MRQQINRLLFLIGIAAIVVMILTFDVSFSELWGYISNAGYWIMAAILLWAGIYALNAQAWRIIMRCSGPCPFSVWKIWQLTVSGYALNATVPVGGVGGMPYKILETSRLIGTKRATSSVVLFAMMHVFSHFWFWLTGVAVYLILALVATWSIDSTMVLLLVLTSLISCGGIWLFRKCYHYGLVSKMVLLIGKIPGLHHKVGRFYDNHRLSFVDIDQQITALWNHNKKAFRQSLLLEYLCRWLQALEVFFILVMLGQYAGVLTFLFAFLIIAFTSLFANLAGFIPLQLGVREGGFALTMALFGLAPEGGLIISIICRVREIVWAIIGIVIMKLK